LSPALRESPQVEVEQDREGAHIRRHYAGQMQSFRGTLPSRSIRVARRGLMVYRAVPHCSLLVVTQPPGFEQEADVLASPGLQQPFLEFHSNLEDASAVPSNQ
jgi:hypothetical protein